METLIWLGFVVVVGGPLVIAGLFVGVLMLRRSLRRRKRPKGNAQFPLPPGEGQGGGVSPITFLCWSC